jgi:type II secretory ATPase GspE/PulE/Tfp pilus assembly ATPase PilB-like protein
MVSKVAPQTQTPNVPLSQVLVEANLITPEQLQQAQQLQQQGKGSLGAILVDSGWVSDESLAMALSLYLNLPLIDLRRHSVQPSGLRHIPEAIARKNHLIGLDIIDGALVVVMADPTNAQVIEELTAQSGMRIMPMVGSRDDIDAAIALNYKASGEIQRQLAKLASMNDPATAHEEPRKVQVTAEDPIVRAVDMILEQAVRDRSSDIHLTPTKEAVIVRYRVDGMLQNSLTLPRSVHQPLIARVKVLAKMSLPETPLQQDGQFSVMFGDSETCFRVTISNTSWGEMAVLRLLGLSQKTFDLNDLGLPPESLSSVRKMFQAPFGMILVAGPPGSGKTTTLYAALNQIECENLNIMTIEDPVETDLHLINQIKVDRRAGITFASGLRAIMRLDPDVIMVGEIVDPETAEVATQAALTGHLVLSSVLANDAPGALFRLANLGIERYLEASAVLGVVAQRLVRRICPHCRTLAKPTPEERAAYRAEMKEDLGKFSAGQGCNFCHHTGYIGRIGVFEILMMTESLRELLMAPVSASELKSEAIRQGMIPMRRNGMMLVKHGITTPDEVLRSLTSLD